ncbi:MAG: AAA family ATPase [Gammaproteobacteria bacterium]
MQKIQKICEALNTGVLEKEEAIAVSLLAALAGQNVFLLGPPGTAKSLIARRLASVFETSAYFEYLMQRFSTPEEVFGPISLAELKKDNYIRKVEGYLPVADFAFLDEIWKSSPAVLNTLLTIINEKKFRNGTDIKTVPLKALISASNETPPANQGLEALYDRFLVRLLLSPVQEKNSFEEVIQQAPAKSEVDIKEGDRITNKEFESWQVKIDKVKLSPETLNVIQAVRVQIELSNKDREQKIYVSDRRWQRAARLLKAGAYFCDRKITNLVDTLLLRHCLWSTDSDREPLQKIVEDAVQENGLNSAISFSTLEKNKNKLDQEIQNKLYYLEKIYETSAKIQGNTTGYLKYKVSYQRSPAYHHYRTLASSELVHEIFYIKENLLGTNVTTHPVDKLGNELKHITCIFNKQDSFNVTVQRNNLYIKKDNGDIYKRIDESLLIKPQIQFNKGDVRRDINTRLFSSLTKSAEGLISQLQKIRDEIDQKKEKLEQEIHSPFVLKFLRDLAITSVTEQIERINIAKTDCENFLSKINKAEKSQ